MYSELKKIQKNRTPVWIKMESGEDIYGFILACSEAENFVKIRHLGEIKIDNQDEIEVGSFDELMNLIHEDHKTTTIQSEESIEDFKAITSLFREENIQELHLEPYEFISSGMFEALSTLSVELYGISLEPNSDDILSEERD